VSGKVELHRAIYYRIFELKLAAISEGFMPAEAFPAITPLAYSERCVLRSQLPDIGLRGLRCGSIIKL
jgi:hypothetical protein